jgi:ribonuclease HII
MARTPPDSLFPDYPAIPDYRFERHFHAERLSGCAGLDEAGRGPLAGPVVAAAVILDPECIPEGLDDSKALSKARRELLFEAILRFIPGGCRKCLGTRNRSHGHPCCEPGSDARALCALPVKPHYALVDGRDIPPGLDCAARALVKGDARSLSIAAASIIAKVTRDSMMTRAVVVYPAVWI